jgi:hypothetical protein
LYRRRRRGAVNWSPNWLAICLALFVVVLIAVGLVMS